MDAKSQLMHEKEKLLKLISESAQRGDSQEVLAVSEKLNKVESLMGRYEKLLRDISDLDTISKPQPLDNTRARSSLVKDNAINRLDTAGRGIGRTIRLDFLKKASESGVHLTHIKGSIYETGSGHKVGIAFATERKPDRWFLGLPFGRFDHAVLLCMRDTKETVEICLPNDFFEEYRDHMSQSSGQMKFNIVRRGNGYSILVPSTDGVSVSKFIGDYALLK